MENLLNLAPALLFLAALLYISYWVQQQSSEARSSNFVKDYFIGGRSLGGFVLAMTTVATYSSVSTFVGGPGVAWQIGGRSDTAGCTWPLSRWWSSSLSWVFSARRFPS